MKNLFLSLMISSLSLKSYSALETRTFFQRSFMGINENNMRIPMKIWLSEMIKQRPDLSPEELEETALSHLEMIQLQAPSIVESDKEGEEASLFAQLCFDFICPPQIHLLFLAADYKRKQSFYDKIKTKDVSRKKHNVT